MLPPPTDETIAALAKVPTGTYLLTTAFGEIRDGRLVDRVQQCGTNPPMLLIAMEKGHALSPLIRDSRTFGLSLLDPQERHLQRIFGPERRIGDNPFLTQPHKIGVLGAPIVTRATAWFDCEVVRHLDMETNYELYIGLVHEAGVGATATQRLNAALTAARPSERLADRAARARLTGDRLPSAESPSERLRASKSASKATTRSTSK
jgi:flavin reductase (DIM6/NTAB) family NADH-FMN oxidoreductase RutF